MKIRFDPDKIRELREASGLSLYRFGMTLGTSAQAVDKWEKGITKPSVKTIEKLCGQFNVPPEYFFVQNHVGLHT